MKHFTRHFDNFFLSEIFQWHLKTPKDDRSVLLRVIVFRQRTVCYDVRNTWTRALPSVFVRRSIDVILVFLGMASVWIQLQLLDQKNISVLAMEWLISRIWNQRRKLNRVLLLNYRRICWFVCWFLFSSEATRSSVEALALQASVFFSSLLKGSLITSE